jgi:hypothetical protein
MRFYLGNFFSIYRVVVVDLGVRRDVTCGRLGSSSSSSVTKLNVVLTTVGVVDVVAVVG